MNVSLDAHDVPKFLQSILGFPVFVLRVLFYRQANYNDTAGQSLTPLV